MNSRDYWAERARQDKIKVIKTGEQGIDNLKRVLKTNLDNVEKKIKEFYDKYGDNPAENLSYDEFEKYKHKLRAKAKKYPKDKTLQKLAKLDIPKYKIDRLRALQTDLQIQLTEATAGQEAGIYKTLEDVGKVAQATLAKRFTQTFDLEFDTIASRKMKQLLSSDWSGATWSERLWKDRELVGNKMTEILEKGVIQGTSLQKMSRELKQATGQSFNNSFRIIRTETSHLDGQVTLEGYRQAGAELGLEYYVYDAFLDSRTSNICRELDKKRFRIDDAEVGVNYPPMHPNCRSTTQLVLDDDIQLKEPKQNPKEEVKEAENATVEKEEKQAEYKTFNNGDDVNKFFYDKPSYKEWKSNLTEDMKDVITQYTDFSDDINQYLRKLNDWEYIDKEMVEGQIGELDKAIKQFELNEPIKVIRGVGLEPFGNKLNDLSSLVGQEFSDKGFMSTSLIKDGAKKEKPVELILKVPSGKGRGAYINEFSSFSDEEYEFLLKRNSKYKITNAQFDNDTYILEADILP